MTKEKETKCDDLIDALLEKHGISQEAILGENGLVAQLKKRVVERALAGELTHHLGYAKGEAPEELENHRNGYSEKTVVGEEGAMKIEVPRDRSGGFEPLLIAKGQKRFEGFEEKIIAMYARGMTVREIQGFLLDQYKVEVRATPGERERTLRCNAGYPNKGASGVRAANELRFPKHLQVLGSKRYQSIY